MTRTRNISTPLLVQLIWVAQPGPLLACSTCYGDPNSTMSVGLTWAITVLVGVVGCVLAGVVAFFVRTIRKAAVDGNGNDAK